MKRLSPPSLKVLKAFADATFHTEYSDDATAGRTMESTWTALVDHVYVLELGIKSLTETLNESQKGNCHKKAKKGHGKK